MQSGTSINHYRISGELGAGGMGQVYRAEDTRLKRDVAIKVLPPELARDPERLSRMEREAQVLAALNHPHVAAIYGLEEARGDGGESTRFLVMELVEGESLAERIVSSGPMAPDTAIEIARGIARGLEAAHEKGIVHRDLKPANVMLGNDGSVKVLDFGLAKATVGASSSLSADLSASPTVMGTQAGVILGTASYMSPEQARGKAVDKRADIWAFGCVLYEMLGGRRPFDGETATDIIAAVVRAEPDVDKLPGGTPPRLRELVRRCLVKDPAQRLRDIGDARIELDHVHEQPIIAAATSAPSGIRPVLFAGAVVAALALGAVASVLLRSGPPPPPVRRAIVANESSVPFPMAVSPSGDTLVYAGNGGLRLRLLSEEADSLLDGTQGALLPAWGPDGMVYFMQNGALRRVDVRAGGAVTVAEPPDNQWFFLAVGADGTVYSARGVPGGQVSVDAIDTATGTSRPVAQWSDADDRFFAPRQVVADGSALLGMSFEITGGFPEVARMQVELLRLADGTRTVLATGFAWPWLLEGGQLLMIDPEQRLVSTQLDLATGKLAGVPVPRLDGLALQGFFSSYSVAADGSLFYVSGGGSGANERTLQWIDRQGASTAISEKAHFYDTDSRISPDGRYLALERSDVRNVWIHDLQRDTQSPLDTTEKSSFPVWSPDSRRVAAAVNGPSEGQPGIFLFSVDRSAPPVRLTTASDGRYHLPTDWSRDGVLLYVDGNSPLRGGDANDLWLVEGTGGSEPHPFLTTPAREVEARFSPAGRWIAYESNHSGRVEVYVRAADGSGGEIPVSTDGGLRPSWNPAGGELFYFASGRRLMSVKVQPQGEFIPDVPREIWKLPDGLEPTLVEPDRTGERFLVIRSVVQDAQNRLLAIFNWTQTLAR